MKRIRLLNLCVTLMFVLITVLMFVVLANGFCSVFADGKEKQKKEVKSYHPRSGLELLTPLQDQLSGPVSFAIEQHLFRETPQRVPASQGGIGGSVPYRSPAPAFSRNLLISRDSGLPIHTEPHIAVNPNDPNHVVIAEIDYALQYNPVYVSFDGGENWRGPTKVPLTRDTFFAGDPVVAFDRKSNAYQAFMGIGEQSYDLGLNFPLNVPKSDIAVSSSKDGGLKWIPPAVAAQNKLVYEFERWPDGSMRLKSFELSFLDKPWMGIGQNPEDSEKDVVYVSYTAFIQTYLVEYFGVLIFFRPVRYESVIEATASKDNGLNWSVPQEVSPRRTIFELGKQTDGAMKTWVVQGSQLKVAKDGIVYIAWYDSADDDSSKGKGQIYTAKSKNGGNTWDRPILAAEFLEVSRSPNSVPFRNSSSFPRLDMGTNGEVYLVYGAIPEDKQTDEGDIYFVSSPDGEKFSKPVRLNQDRTENIQFFPAIAADPAGNLHVMWGDTRDDPTGLKYHMYYTRSLDKGETWGFELKELGIKEPDTRVTDFPSNPHDGFPYGKFIGDYFAIAAASEKDIYMVWADTRLGKYGSTSQKIGFARRQAISSPETFLNPARGSAGEEVTLQAFNFQPDMDIFARIGGRITPMGRTNEDGRLTYKLFMPIASGGSHEVAVFDESGNFASGSFYMDFGFSDLNQQTSKAQPVAESEMQTEEPQVSQREDNDTGDKLVRFLIALNLITGGGLVLSIGLLALLLRKSRSS